MLKGKLALRVAVLPHLTIARFIGSNERVSNTCSSQQNREYPQSQLRHGNLIRQSAWIAEQVRLTR